MSKRIELFFKNFFFYITNFIFFLFLTNPAIFLNDYLNPYTLTFKNPKTLQMFNIIILYHYVMAFLVGIIIFTFIFIFLSFFRSYFFFNYKTYYKPYSINSFSEFLAYFRRSLYYYQFIEAYNFFIDYIRTAIIRQKNKHLEFYKKDIKASLTDQIKHAPLLEFLWVIFPAIILIIIAYPSIILLYYNEAYVEPVFNITVIGNQWFWTYEYNDFNLLKLFKKHITNDKNSFRKLDYFYGKFLTWSSSYHNKHVERDKKLMNEILATIPQRLTVDCNMIIAKDPKFLRLLTTDQCLVIPAKTPIRFLITSADVIHSWAIPSYGVKLDAVPGRINQQILSVPLMGTSWGQCSELCGVNHAFMPIEIKVLAFSDFLYFIQLRVKEILFPILENYYTEKMKFVKKYVKMVYSIKRNFLYNYFSIRPFGGEIWVKETLHWDIPRRSIHSYFPEELLRKIFSCENPDIRKEYLKVSRASAFIRWVHVSLMRPEYSWNTFTFHDWVAFVTYYNPFLRHKVTRDFLYILNYYCKINTKAKAPILNYGLQIFSRDDSFGSKIPRFFLEKPKTL